jgi:hypothetical protein
MPMFTAALQRAPDCDAPVLLSVRDRASHAGRTGRSRRAASGPQVPDGAGQGAAGSCSRPIRLLAAWQTASVRTCSTSSLRIAPPRARSGLGMWYEFSGE